MADAPAHRCRREVAKVRLRRPRRKKCVISADAGVQVGQAGGGRAGGDGTDMNQVLLFLHFVGLMLGATGGFGSALVMRRALAAGPEAAGVLRGLGPMLANVSGTGVALMWASGLVMVWSRWGGPGNLPQLLLAEDGARPVADGGGGGDPPDLWRDRAAASRRRLARLPKLGPVAGVSALLAVLTAVLRLFLRPGRGGGRGSRRARVCRRRP